MNFEELCNTVLNENIMLKNSLNIYAKQAADAIGSADSLRIVVERIERSNDDLVRQLNAFSKKLDERLVSIEKKFVRRMRK